MHSVDDLARVDSLQISRGDPEVRVSELALNDRQRDPFVRHPEVRPAHRMRMEDGSLERRPRCRLRRRTYRILAGPTAIGFVMRPHPAVANLPKVAAVAEVTKLGLGEAVIAALPV
jgi:hypothetical protein